MINTGLHLLICRFLSLTLKDSTTARQHESTVVRPRSLAGGAHPSACCCPAHSTRSQHIRGRMRTDKADPQPILETNQFECPAPAQELPRFAQVLGRGWVSSKAKLTSMEPKAHQRAWYGVTQPACFNTDSQSAGDHRRSARRQTPRRLPPARLETCCQGKCLAL